MAAEDDVVVIGLGMMTAVGLSPDETAASVRAGTMRFTELAWRDRRFQPFTVAEVVDDGLPDLADALAAEGELTYRESRMLRLGVLPLAAALRPVRRLREPIGLLLSLPDTETTLPLDRIRFLRRFAVQTEEAFKLDLSEATFRGRAGGLLAIGRASQRIREGKTRFCLAGGIDCYRDLHVLGTLDREQRVKSSSNLDGFIPGEGAGFVLLANREAADRAGLSSLARLTPVADGFEEGHLYSEEPYRGEGLAMTFEKFFAEGDPTESVQMVYASMNGENHWAKEWGVAFMRHKSRFSPEPRLLHPADCFGDLGAACGPVLVGLASLGLSKRFLQGPCLVYASADRGERAVLAVARP